MTPNPTSAKSIVDQLSFTKKTAKRVAWEAWEFTIVGPHQVKVTNASYGFQKTDHEYVVDVEVRGGLAVPAGCDCPADIHTEKYDCKHKVALATVGGPTVLNAAVDYENRAPASSESEPEAMADRVRADGGRRYQREGATDCDCADLSGDFPCWSCVRKGERGLPK